MKKTIFLASLVCVMPLISFSQVNYAAYNYVLQEKVRTPEVAEYLLDLKKHQDNHKQYGTPFPDDFPTIEAFMKSLTTIPSSALYRKQTITAMTSS